MLSSTGRRNRTRPSARRGGEGTRISASFEEEPKPDVSMQDSRQMNDTRFVVAMSGGVDSSVAAWMLREEGLSLVGLFMRNGVHVDEAESSKKSCCSIGDARDARMVAAHLGIPFQ